MNGIKNYKRDGKKLFLIRTEFSKVLTILCFLQAQIWIILAIYFCIKYSLDSTYANVIMWGIKSFDKAPKRLKSDIALILYVNGCEDLITDKTYVEEAKERVEEAEANMQ